MKPLDRDIHILEHIVSYCQQIEETVARFGNDGSIFSSDPIYRNAAAICIQQKRLEHFSKGSVSKLAHAKSRKPTLLKHITRVPLGYALLAHGFGLSRQDQQLSLLVTHKSGRILKGIDCLDWAAHYLLHCLQAMCDFSYIGCFSWLHH